VEITLSELAASLGGTILSGSGELVLRGLNSLADAAEGDLSFFGNSRYLQALRETHASAVLVPRQFAESNWCCALLAVDNPSLAFAQVMAAMAPPKAPFEPGVHTTAVVHPSCRFDPGATAIGPHVTIEADVTIGRGTAIEAGCFLGRGVRVGAGCTLHPRVTVLYGCLLGDRVILHTGVVIGADGFGFELVGARHEKIQQIGIVQIDDEVEIGANSCVDRARFGKTHIGAGTKIDNLVQIGHNVVIGRNCIIAGQVGIAGSTRLRDGVILAAQVGVVGHIELGSGVIISAQSGVAKTTREPGVYMGYHAEPIRRMLRIQAAMHQLPELVQRLRRLEKRSEAQDQ
jgi:UDP-3-O-[3-hydroxymyristoyl] glucosamine N-acyltransferase